ncbi:gluconate 2-dehydrogenase subunit 3 family protein [Paraburkholderia sp. RL17-383-BIF-A]|jgi:gluconate 2-dehydrogenase gamma chain|uniref:gluconate 2-dehydrogenase subunit 3 family protein n=1 Tax=Burkholderiaceae TaxID=119060 RepID=UPI00089ACC5D|nr:gluconate 2-dehydrogenase subunit 3 family protein [Burkholderia sp. WP9]SEF04778.1 gluconate 2-dehydrogenase gamma chain [Burkholderia sp. WP9]
MKRVGISPGRRAFLRSVASAGPAAVAIGAGVAGVAASSTAGNTPNWTPSYFTPDEWSVLVALVDRLIPADSEGPGAIEAGVPEFIDSQMNTPYGYGALWYMHGPFVAGPATLGYQLEFSPRALYRSALAGLDEQVRKRFSKRFDELDASTRDSMIGELESGKLGIGDVPAVDFFAQLLQNTHEGYFCDPKHGGNRDMAAWKMINFPGARADYIDWVEQYGKRYPLAPVSSA